MNRCKGGAKLLFRVVSAVLVVCLSACSLNPTRPPSSPTDAELEHQMLVMLKAPSQAPLGPWDDPAVGYSAGRGRAISLRTARALAREYHLSIVDDWAMPAIGLHCVVAVPERAWNPERTLEALNADGRVAWAQRVQRYRGLRQTESADPQAAPSSWRDLDALHAVASGRAVTIAEVDTGVDLRHPSLSGQWTGPRDFVSLGRFDAELHGTGVAGVIVARANVKVGMVGVAPGARLMPLRGCWQVDAAKAICTSFTLAKALQHALLQGVQVINLSLTGPPDLLLERLLDRALARGIAVVAAADENEGGPGFPARHAGVIAVAGHPVHGLEHALQAPSEDVLTTTPNGAFGFLSGSSFAAAHIAGLAALLLELSPRLTPLQLRAVLEQASTSGERSGEAARVDPCAALLAVVGDRRLQHCAPAASEPDHRHHAAVHSVAH